MSFFTGFGVSAVVYYILNRIWPSPGAFQDFKEVDESEFELREAEAGEGEYPSDADSKDKLQSEGNTDAVARST
jgi:NCS1 family nucleobase:cation symporter-1